MDAEIKRKWVEALRSGEYAQGHQTLRDETGAMCCLGVLAHIQGCDLGSWSHEDRQTIRLPPEYDAGLVFHQCRELAVMNDGLWTEANGRAPGKSFSEIADYIEEHL
jgi:hypothetical protein